MAGATYTWTGPSVISGSNSQTATVTTNGNYSVTVTNALGCTYTYEQNVLFASPTISYTLVQDTLVLIPGMLTLPILPIRIVFGGIGEMEFIQ